MLSPPFYPSTPPSFSFYLSPFSLSLPLSLSLSVGRYGTRREGWWWCTMINLVLPCSLLSPVASMVFVATCLQTRYFPSFIISIWIRILITRIQIRILINYNIILQPEHFWNIIMLKIKKWSPFRVWMDFRHIYLVAVMWQPTVVWLWNGVRLS